MATRKFITPKTSTNKVYLVIYDQQEFLGYDINTPIKAFKIKKTAELYANSRNFEFQSICMLDEEKYENYVLSNEYSDFIISVSDFREAYAYVREEMIRLEKNRIPTNLWVVLQDIKPFKVIPIEYLSGTKET